MFRASLRVNIGSSRQWTTGDNATSPPSLTLCPSARHGRQLVPFTLSTQARQAGAADLVVDTVQNGSAEMHQKLAQSICHEQSVTELLWPAWGGGLCALVPQSCASRRCFAAAACGLPPSGSLNGPPSPRTVLMIAPTSVPVQTGRDRTLMLRSHCCVLILRSRAAALWRRLHSMEYRWLGSM